jgi:hypothetical protein
MGVAVFLGLLLIVLALVCLGLWWVFQNLHRASLVLWHKVRPDGQGGHSH